MRNKASLMLCGLALITLLGTQPADAQISLGFVNPVLIDPPTVLTFTNVNIPVFSNGAALIPDTGFQNGTELHAAIPGNMGGLLDVTQVIMTFTYNGSITVNTSADGGFASWDHTESMDPGTHLWTVIYTLPAISGGAPINNNFDPGGPPHQAFAGLNIAGDSGALNDFLAMNPNNDSIIYRVGAIGRERGSSDVPEPGTLALLGGLGVGGGVFAWRRRRLRK